MILAQFTRWKSGAMTKTRTTSHHYVDRSGQRYGRLVVIEYAGTNNWRNALWLCLCDCGIKVIVTGPSLSRGNTKSCGCLKNKPRKPLGRTARNQVHSVYRSHARIRGYVWELSDEEFDKLTAMNCFYCNQPPATCRNPRATYGGGEFIYNGIDRVNNDLGYILENVVTCCEICNRAKKDMSLDDFMGWIARLVTYRGG